MLCFLIIIYHPYLHARMLDVNKFSFCILTIIKFIMQITDNVKTLQGLEELAMKFLFTVEFS